MQAVPDQSERVERLLAAMASVDLPVPSHVYMSSETAAQWPDHPELNAFAKQMIEAGDPRPICIHDGKISAVDE
jgi:hypothetical protein